ncbi:hypothetical protein CXB51_032677 [Gossypium anomalum]|uniref:Uncharacterized protein n=1 Tax=Gossypium anomalum TaxID=47600 RepID=A0A8J5XVY9_9ROSI|nr:hypothetical protein CXB51_032677 [Gossypium anomalum]
MPGGVNSPVRAFNLVGGLAVVIDSVKGCCVWDTDGNEYVNYVGSWGHADDDEVLAALAETLKKGTSFGTPCLSENVLAEMVIAAVPSIKMKHAWALPLPFTEWQRSSNLGDVTDPSLVKDGSGVATLGCPTPPLVLWWGSGVFWSNSRFNNRREEKLGGGLPVGSIWGKEGDYGDGGTNRANVPGWDLEWEPTGNDSWQLKEPGTYDA